MCKQKLLIALTLGYMGIFPEIVIKLLNFKPFENVSNTQPRFFCFRFL